MKPTHFPPLLLAFLAPAARAEIRLPALIGEHMVLQQRALVPLWGFAEPGEAVVVEASWGARAEGVADERGSWRIALRTPAAGGPHSIFFLGANRIELGDVLVGEVWLCSGQSNMEMSISAEPPGYYGVEDSERELAAAARPRIRLFDVANELAGAPRTDCKGSWSPCSPASVAAFSAVGYFFGAELERELDVPIGLVAANWGGTVAEAWTSAPGLAAFPDFLTAFESARAAGGDSLHPNLPTVLFNGMIAPLAPFRLAGVIWYQGESNCTRARQYRTLFPALIADWRAHFERADLPFYYVQIAPFAYGDYYPEVGQAADLRDAQRLTLQVPHTGMAVTLDIGDPADIHPKKKREVGRRLALWALAKTYGRSELAHSGPLYRALSIEGGRARIAFEHAGGGLVAQEGGLAHFAVAGADRRFVPARAEIEGEELLVWSPEVPEPVAVRYAFGAADTASLFNAAGLPASSFRTDDWPIGE